MTGKAPRTFPLPPARDLLLVLYGAIGIGALVAAAPPPDAAGWALLAFLLAVSLVAARFEASIGNIDFSGEFLPIVVSCMLMPHTATVVGLSAAAGRYRSAHARAVSTATYVIAAALASFVVRKVGSVGADLVGNAGLTAAAGTVFLVANGLLVVSFLAISGIARPRDTLPSLAGSLVATALFTFPLLVCVATAYGHLGVWGLTFVLLPITLAQYFHWLYRRKSELTVDLATAAQTLARANLQFAAAMVRALDARDAYTAGHSAAVAVYCRDIAREVGCDERTIALAHLAGLLHDIGKIGVPGRVLNKTKPLDDEEYELMKEHAAIGADILGEVDSYAEISTLVRHHHERIDGRGYPDGIGGEFIPSISRMISVADTYSAMTTDRPYRQGLDPAIACEEIAKSRGTQLDAMYSDAFLRVLERADDAYRRGKQVDFEVEVAKHEALGTFEQDVLELASPGSGSGSEVDGVPVEGKPAAASSPADDAATAA